MFNNCFRLQPQSYKNGDAAWDMIHIITKYFDKILKERLTKSPFYGIIVDETIDRSMDTQVIIYIQYICKDENKVYKPRIDYLDIVIPENQSAMGIKVFSFRLILQLIN